MGMARGFELATELPLYRGGIYGVLVLFRGAQHERQQPGIEHERRNGIA